MQFFNSDQADQLFSDLKLRSPGEVISALRFVEENWLGGPRRPLFEYDTDHNHAWYLLGLAYEEMRQIADSARCFLTAAEVWPDDADSFVAFSNTEEDLVKQVSVLEEALGRLDDPRIRLNLAHAYLDLGRVHEAEKHLLIVSTIWPDDNEVKKSLKRSRRRKSTLPTERE